MSNGSKETLEYLQVIANQNAAIISLLGRLAFTEKQIKKLITNGKRQEKREGYLKGYNACNGTRTSSEIAEIVDVDVSSFSRASDSWESLGIIYVVPTPRGKSYGKYYKHIYPVDI